MKHKNQKNSNGIAICDSIIMSVKRKRPNFRTIEAVLIAICGFTATILCFFSMFDFNYNRPAVVFSAILFSAVYFTVLGNHDWDVASRGTAQPGDPFVRSVGGRPGQ